jgi:Mg-chelatase subunit ChlD
MANGGLEMSGDIEKYRDKADDLLDSAANAGLDPAAVGIMKINLDKITLAGSRSSDLDGYKGDTIVLVTLIIDESPSMRGVEDLVKRCYKDMLSALVEKVPNSGIQISTWVFSGGRKLLNSFRPVVKAPRTIDVYDTSTGIGTALYDTVLSALTSQVVLSHEAWGADKKTRNVVIVLSDGDDNMSLKDCIGTQTKELAQTLIEQGDYILAYVGFGTNEPLPVEQCRRLADCIGFNEIISVGKTEEDMVRIFKKLVSSIVRVSTSTGLERVEKFFD